VETLDASSPVPADETGETAVAALFPARYLDMVRLAVLLGADDAEDIAGGVRAVADEARDAA
jgi:hypothetical protein